MKEVKTKEENQQLGTLRWEQQLIISKALYCLGSLVSHPPFDVAEMSKIRAVIRFSRR